MPGEPVTGICRMCLDHAELKESHVWSSFLYKNYVADLKKGGQVVSLFESEPQNQRQITRFWLCTACEQKLGNSETRISRLLRRMEKEPAIPHKYDEHLSRFVTSISWRVLHLLCERMNRGLIEDRWPAVKYWRQFLGRKRPDLAGFTQHCFVVFDDSGGTHKIISGSINHGQNILIAQAGPLLIVGRLGKHYASMREKDIWRRSEVLDEGAISVLQEWNINVNVTATLHRALSQEYGRIVDAVKRRPLPYAR